MSFAANFAATFFEPLQIIFRGKSRGKLLITLEYKGEESRSRSI
jgi:hypothetical protein